MDFIDKRKPIMSYMGGYYTSTNMIVFASLHNFTASHQCPKRLSKILIKEISLC